MRSPRVVNRIWAVVLLVLLGRLIALAAGEAEPVQPAAAPEKGEAEEPVAAISDEVASVEDEDEVVLVEDEVATGGDAASRRREDPADDRIYGLSGGEPGAPARPAGSLERGFTLFGYLLMIGALAVAGMWFFRNNPRFQRRASGLSRTLRIAETRPLGQKQFLTIVECDGQRLLLGISPGKMDFLCRLSRPGQPEDGIEHEGE